MGGRAGRSKGCLTCRKRHLKCGWKASCHIISSKISQRTEHADWNVHPDETRPTCLRCRQTGHHCDGYVPLAFINENARFEAGSTSPPAHVVRRRKPLTHDLHIAGSPSLAPMLDDICITHLQHNLFVTDPQDDLPPWLGFRALEGGETLDLSLRCLHSLARAHFGQVQHAKAVLDGSSQLYVESLHTLNGKIRDPAQRGDDDVLMAVWILTAYELLVLSTSTGWISHALGLGKLIELRGPAAFTHGLAHDIFENTRFLIILASFAVAKRTFLAQMAWRTVPWGLSTNDHVRMSEWTKSRKSPMHCLLDVIAELPGLREEINEHHESEGGDKSSILAAKTSSIYTALRRWRHEWDNTPEGIITMASTSTSSSRALPREAHASAALFWDLPTSPSQPPLLFTSLMAANTVCIYDAALILTVEVIENSSVWRQSQQWHGPTQVDESVPQAQAAAAAHEICRSVFFQVWVAGARTTTSSSGSMSGQFLVLWPLRMAWKALGGSRTEQGRWVERVLAAFDAGDASWGVQQQVLFGKE